MTANRLSTLTSSPLFSYRLRKNPRKKKGEQSALPPVAELSAMNRLPQQTCQRILTPHQGAGSHPQQLQRSR